MILPFEKYQKALYMKTKKQEKMIEKIKNSAEMMDNISFVSGLSEENYESSAEMMENISFI